MNLEKYRAEMSRKNPDRFFIEDTLSSLKNTPKVAPKKHRALKTIGSIGLSAAVLTGAFFGAGAIRDIFKDIPAVPDITQAEITKETEVMEEQPTINADKIEANESGILATPLSNPKYTVRVETEDGKVPLNEDTTVSEMLACGVPVITKNGVLGLEYLCTAIRDYKDKKPYFSFVTADITGDAHFYRYYEIKNSVFSRYWEYDHTHYLSVTKHDEGYFRNDFALLGSSYNEAFSSIELYGSYNNLNSNMGFITMYDTLRVTGMDKEERKALFYKNITSDIEGYHPILSVIYNGECLGKFRMNKFIEKIESGAEYAAVQYTDITTTDEYDERFYSIEYCDGVYSIFTLTDGIGGSLKTEYFDGYELKDNKVIFDNGSARYTFDLSLTPDEDAAFYGESVEIRDDLLLASYRYPTKPSDERLELSFDAIWLQETVRANLLDKLVINEEYSDEEHYALELFRYTHDGVMWINNDAADLYMPDGARLMPENNTESGIVVDVDYELDYNCATLALRYSNVILNEDNVLGTSGDGKKYKLSNVYISSEDDSWEAYLMPDGKYYAILTVDDILTLADSLYVHSDNSISINHYIYEGRGYRSFAPYELFFDAENSEWIVRAR